MRKHLSAAVLVCLLVTACSNGATSAPSPVTHFPQQINTPGGYMAALLRGELELVNGCLRVRDIENNISFLLVWDPRFSTRVEQGIVFVVDADTGQVVASVGDLVAVGGGEVPTPTYLGLVEPLPEECPGPYWVVGEISVLEPGQESGSSGIQSQAGDTGAPLNDAEIYAENMGVSVEEANRQFHLQEVAGELDAALSANESDTFAGLWVEHTPVFRIVVLFTAENGAETLQPYLTDELAEVVEVRTAGTSLAELQQAQIELAAALQDLGISPEMEINVYENNVNVYVTEADGERIEEAVQGGQLQLPEYVSVVVIP